MITYPGMVWGPHDPHLGEAGTFARSVLRGLVPMVPPGELPVVDVRDVAAAHVAVLNPGHGPRRYLLAGGSASLADMIRVIRRLAGRRLVTVTAPAPLVLGITAAGDVAQRVLPFRLPFNFGGVWVATKGGPIDASATERDLGVRFRPPEDSIADMLRWLHATGHLTDRQARLIAGARFRARVWHIGTAAGPLADRGDRLHRRTDAPHDCPVGFIHRPAHGSCDKPTWDVAAHGWRIGAAGRGRLRSNPSQTITPSTP